MKKPNKKQDLRKQKSAEKKKRVKAKYAKASSDSLVQKKNKKIKFFKELEQKFLQELQARFNNGKNP
jgi:hypothetical protein